MGTPPSLMETFGGSGRESLQSRHRTKQLEVASLIGIFPYYDRFMADYDGRKGTCRDRVADSTSSDGSFRRLPDVAIPFNLYVHSGSRVRFPGTPRAIDHCQFACQVQLYRSTWERPSS